MPEDDRTPPGTPGFGGQGRVTNPDFHSVDHEPDMWLSMLARQFRLQTESFHIDFDILRQVFSAKKDYVLRNAYALEDEIHEATNEVDWKPWVDGQVFNRDAFLKELIDAQHFLMNLMLLCKEQGQSVDDFARETFGRYLGKADVNRIRQETGYDGRSSKCECRRAIEDGVPTATMNKGQGYQCQCGKTNFLVDTP